MYWIMKELLFSAFTTSDVIQETKGVYYVDLTVPSENYGQHIQCSMMYWTGFNFR